MRTLSIDLETFSTVDIKKCGAYKYTASPDFEILLFAYAYDDEPVQVVDIASGDCVPEQVRYDLCNPYVLKTAFNAAFEIACINAFYKVELDAAQWECTMVRSAVAGLALSLDAVAKILKLDEQKMDAGKALIRFFCVPCKPTRTNGQRLRNLPHHDSDRWELFKQYCAQDVQTERAIRDKLSFVEITDKERALWVLDQKINRTGVLVDLQLVENAIEINNNYRETLTGEASDLTGLDNPNSVAQLKTWLEEQMQNGEIASLNKESIKELLSDTDCPDVTRLLQLRQEMSKSSVKKYEAMANAAGADSRVRGLLQFYGANRTGRWAGRLVQVQNLPQNHLQDLDLARSLVLDNDAEMLQMLYGNVPSVLSELIRTAFVAKENHTFLVADFSAIEARVIAWLADEQWRLDVFNTHGKIYEASAAQMFKVPIESIGKGSPLRQKGKISELALGYQGGVGALKTMGALKMGLEERELQGLVNAWRNANKAIVRLWNEVEEAAIIAVQDGVTTTVRHGIRFIGGRGMLFAELPSGRKLAYVRPRLKENRFGSMSLAYEGMDQTKKTWGVVDSLSLIHI